MPKKVLKVLKLVGRERCGLREVTPKGDGNYFLRLLHNKIQNLV
ncbi:MAG TPA: hypothetical protein PKY26_04060 [Acetivibrio clariflavus]|nr:hypothetical protein [Acetivibrio clariflavus]